jgi:epoxyqueuosine reductase
MFNFRTITLIFRENNAEKMILDDSVRSFAEECGADLFGVADLSIAHDFILSRGGEDVASYPRAISIGIALLHTIVDQLPRRDEAAVAVSYRHHAYDIINERLDIIASRLCSLLQKEGYRAYPVPAAKRVDDERICSFFSHKLAAHLAGLGWIGKSCLLITPEAGPRVRWTTVLTDAPLAPGRPLQEQCGDCQECVRICPVCAFTGRAFREDEPREARYDARKCEAYHKKLEKKNGLGVCGMCVYVCPYGHKRPADWH